jgi:hypothetical protein
MHVRLRQTRIVVVFVVVVIALALIRRERRMCGCQLKET